MGPSGIPGEKGRDVEQPIGRVRENYNFRVFIFDSLDLKDHVAHPVQKVLQAKPD